MCPSKIQWRLFQLRLASSNQGEIVSINDLDDLVLEDLMKIHKAIALKHV